MIKTVILIPSLLVNGVVATALLLQMRDCIGGKRFDISKSNDVSHLRRVIYQYALLQQALESFRSAHSAYPQEASQIYLPFPNYRAELVDSGILFYHRAQDAKSYELHIKLNWDASLHYQSSSNKWEYDPGDGSQITPLLP